MMNKFIKAQAVRQEERIDLSWSCNGDLGKVHCYVSVNGQSDFAPEQGQLIWETKGGYAIDEDNHFVYEDCTPDYRPYFLLVAENGQWIRVAERVLPLRGIVNFRDLGGYETIDGRRVKWGKLLRSGAHDDLTAEDAIYLKNMGLKTVVDYRSTMETSEHPDIKMDGVCYLNVKPLKEAGATNVLDVMNVKMETADDAIKALTGINRQMMSSPQALEAYRTLMLTILDEKQLPLVQHCTAGKDRVGVGAATILLALGVPEETIMKDYLLSNEHQVKQDKLNMSSTKELKPEQIEMFKALTQVHAVYLQAMFDEMRVQFGDADHYLHEGLGLTDEQLAQLKNMFLE